MATREETTNIDGRAYTMTTLGFREGSEVMVRLLKAVGPTIAKMLQGEDKDFSLNDLKASLEKLDSNPGKLGDMLNDLVQALTHEDLMFVFEAVGKYTFLEKGRGRNKVESQLAIEAMDEEFAGDYLGALKYLAWALRVNFQRPSNSSTPNAAVDDRS